jgi:hypothetical protein
MVYVMVFLAACLPSGIWSAFAMPNANSMTASKTDRGCWNSIVKRAEDGNNVATESVAQQKVWKKEWMKLG